jgi:hypothetical protein
MLGFLGSVPSSGLHFCSEMSEMPDKEEYDSLRGLVLDSYHAEDEMLSCSASLVRLHSHE